MKEFPLYGLKVADPKKSVLISDTKTYSYEDILECARLWKGFCGSRKLIAVQARNQIDVIANIFAIIEANNVPILFDPKISRSSFLELIKLYKPDYVLGTFDEIALEGYSKEAEDVSFSIFAKQATNTDLSLSNKLALLLPTSGTTGSPKYARVSYENLTSQAKSISTFLEIDSRCKTVTTLPPQYSFGLSIINSYIYVSGKVHVSSLTPFDRNFWNLIAKEKVSSLSGVPYTFEIWKKSGFLRREFPDLNTITQAGGRLDKSLKAEFLEYCERNQSKFFVMYGQTEATARISYVPPEQLPRKIDSIGIAIPGGKMEIWNSEDNVIDQPWVNGEIVYSGPNVTLGMAESRADLSMPDTMDKILKTGDIGFFDEDGYFFITGRLKRIAKVFGYRVNLDEVEKFLRDRNVEGICISNDDKVVVAIVGELEMQGIPRALSEEYGLPITIFDLHNIREIPRLSNGKVNYDAVSYLLDKN